MYPCPPTQVSCSEFPSHSVPELTILLCSSTYHTISGRLPLTFPLICPHLSKCNKFPRKLIKQTHTRFAPWHFEVSRSSSTMESGCESQPGWFFWEQAVESPQGKSCILVLIVTPASKGDLHPAGAQPLFPGLMSFPLFSSYPPIFTNFHATVLRTQWGRW